MSKLIMLNLNKRSLSLISMQFALGVCVLATMGAVDAITSAARAEGAWCASNQGPDGGYTSCSYTSWNQCMEAVRGSGGICFANNSVSRDVRRARGS